MIPGGLLPVLLLSLAGAGLACGAALLVRRLGEGGHGRSLVAAVGTVGLILACALPFAWLRLFGPALP